MKKSLIDIITEAVATNSPKDVAIHERTLATELIESEKKGDPFTLYNFLPQKLCGRNFVLTYCLLFIVRDVVLFFVALCYALYDLLHRIFIGKWKSKRLKGAVWTKWIQDTKWIVMLHPERWRSIRSSSALNFIIFIATFIFAVIALVLGIHFLIKEVVLPDNDCRVNHYGVVTFDQGCLEEHHFFLLNAATFWTNTGIAISKGDKVYITASGSMYSDIDEMVEAAENNKALLYPRSDFYKKYDRMDPDAGCCIYGRYRDDIDEKDNKPVFGSLLYQICDEVRGPKPYNDERDPKAVRQINFAKNNKSIFKDKRYCFRADRSGILYFSFNDILLDENTIETILKHENQSPQIYRDLLKCDTTLKLVPIDNAIRVLSDSVDSQIWFEDNLGEALVNVRIKKNVWNSTLPFHKKILVAFCRGMNDLYTKTDKGFPVDFLRSNLFVVILIVLFWFGVDAAISKRLKKQV